MKSIKEWWNGDLKTIDTPELFGMYWERPKARVFYESHKTIVNKALAGVVALAGAVITAIIVKKIETLL